MRVGAMSGETFRSMEPGRFGDASMRFLMVATMAALVFSGCASEPQSDGILPFGSPCLGSGECQSGLCVTSGNGQSFCTRFCEDVSVCPGGESWGCVSPVGFDEAVCGCASVGVELCGDLVDNDCDAIADECLPCADGDVPSDRFNCGRCGNACDGDERCVDEQCQCPQASQTSCDGECVDLASSARHCGRCGLTCAEGQSCIDGRCSCDNDSSFCAGVCVDTSTNYFNCGRCGNSCAEFSACVDGECTCTAGETACTDGCADLMEDDNNCGACGNACPVQTECNGGQCVCSNSAYIPCDGVCVFPNIDEEHCGACGNVCDEGETCVAGVCRCASMIFCDGECLPLGDDENCGACGNVCEAGQRCIGLNCQ